MKGNKSIVRLAFAIAIFLVTTGGAKAEISPPPSEPSETIATPIYRAGDPSVKSIITKYNLQVATKIPDNVKPIKLNSLAELDNYLAKYISDLAASKEVQNNANQIQAVGPVTRSCSKGVAGATFNGTATWQVYTSGSFRSISGYSAGYTSLTGWTAGLSLVNTGIYESYRSGTSAAATAYGTVQTYILIPGVVVIRQDSVGCTVTLNLY